MDAFLNSILSQLPVVGVFLVWAYFVDKARAQERKDNEAAREKERIAAEAAKTDERKAWAAERSFERDAWLKEREAWAKERQADQDLRERMETRFEDTLDEERKSRELQAQLFVKSMDAINTTIDGKLTTFQEEFRKAVAIMMERTAGREPKTRPIKPK